MNKNTFLYFTTIFYFLILAPISLSQSLPDTSAIDKSFLESLPDSVKSDVLEEMKNNSKDKTTNFNKRPSSQLSKLDTIKDWENFKRAQLNTKKSERYGIKLFNSMQSSFMPLNEPNFGSDYVVDYGDALTIQLLGSSNELYIVEVLRSGAITLEDIGQVVVAGLNFEQVSDLIKNKYKNSMIGVDVVVSLSEIRDINILITGKVDFPGMYTLSGNSNVLQALNIAGGISETGSLRNIIIKRKGEPDRKVDLYEALIFGNTDNIPFLMSGDSLHIEPVKNLVRAGHGFNTTAVFELNDGESMQDLIRYSGGLNIEAGKSLNLVRFEKGAFNTFTINLDESTEYKAQNLDSVYAQKEAIGTVTITGDVKHPGIYSIASQDKILDLIQRSGGYLDSAYIFGSSLHREKAKELETIFADKAYQNLISFIASSPDMLGENGGQGLGLILNELKDHNPAGRVIAEFNQEILTNNMQQNIYLEDGDIIHIPSYSSNVYVFGEAGNPGAVLFKDGLSTKNYIMKSGGLTKFASSNFVFLVSPNGETKKINISGLLSFVDQDYEIYPGSVIYIPRHVGKIEGIALYATLAPIFSSLALSIASLNSINN